MKVLLDNFSKSGTHKELFEQLGIIFRELTCKGRRASSRMGIPEGRPDEANQRACIKAER
jgi:hypothetical protein